MKTAKIITALSVALALPTLAVAQISPFVSAQVEAATRPCIDLSSASAGQPQSRARDIAIAALDPCYQALRTLDNFERTNASGLTPDEKNYLYYMGGTIIWIAAGSEAMKNNGLLTPAICQQAYAAESAWSKVNVPTGTQIDIDMRTNELRRILLPACQRAQ